MDAFDLMLMARRLRFGNPLPCRIVIAVTIIPATITGILVATALVNLAVLLVINLVSCLFLLVIHQTLSAPIQLLNRNPNWPRFPITPNLEFGSPVTSVQHT